MDRATVELIGIIVGIISGTVVTLATIWTCIFKIWSNTECSKNLRTKLNIPRKMIDCFGCDVLPDYIDRLIQLLKDRYLKKLKYCEPVPWREGLKLNLSDVYTKLELVTRDFRENETLGDSLEEDLLNHTSLKILIEGHPGIGKSTTFRKIVLDWALGSKFNILANFFFPILIEVRQQKEGDITDAIFEQILPEDTELDREKIRKYLIQNAEKIIIFYDGFDEASKSVEEEILRVVKSKLLSKSTILIASRPNRRKDLISYIDQHNIIKGFSRENVNNYIRRYFKDSEREVAELLIKKINKNENILNVACNPMAAVLLCILWQDNLLKFPSTLTSLYSELVKSIYLNYCKRTNRELPTVENLLEIDDFVSKLAPLGKLCFEARKVNGERFFVQNLKRAGVDCEFLLVVGICSVEYSANNTFYTCLHLTFLEFLASLFLLHSKLAYQKTTLNNMINNENLHNVYLFTVGLLGNDGKFAFEELVSFKSYERTSLVELVLASLHEAEYHFVKEVASFIIQNDSLDLITTTCNDNMLGSLLKVLNFLKADSVGIDNLNKIFLSRNIPFSESSLHESILDHVYATNNLTVLYISIFSTHLKKLTKYVRNSRLKHLVLSLSIGRESVNEINFENSSLKFVGVEIFRAGSSEIFTRTSHNDISSCHLQVNKHLLFLTVGGRHYLAEDIFHNFLSRSEFFSSVRAFRWTLLRTSNHDHFVKNVTIFLQNNSFPLLSKLWFDSIELDRSNPINAEFCDALRNNLKLKITIVSHWEEWYPSPNSDSWDAWYNFRTRPGNRLRYLTQFYTKLKTQILSPFLSYFKEYVELLSQSKSLKLAVLMMPTGITGLENPDSNLANLLTQALTISHELRALIILNPSCGKSLKHIGDHGYTYQCRFNNESNQDCLRSLIVQLDCWFLEVSEFEEKFPEKDFIEFALEQFLKLDTPQIDLHMYKKNIEV